MLHYLIRQNSSPAGGAFRLGVTEPEATAVDVASWMRSLGLGLYKAAFRENDVSANMLRDLTAEDLEGLGVAASAIGVNCWWPSPSCGTAHHKWSDRPTVPFRLCPRANVASLR
jgi:hypothetical protein